MAFGVSDQESSLSATAGKVITCKAAVAYEVDTPLSFEDVHVAPPGPTEVRIRVTHAAVCQSDLYYLKGKDRGLIFPRIMGHEGAGIVESVGSAITDLKPGDKVIPVWQAECQKCPRCLSGRSNICDMFLQHFDSGVMPCDETSRFSRVADGKPIFHFFGTSVFSQYTVLDEACVAKINPNADLSKVCLLGCGVSTGIGSAWNIAKVTPNSSVAVFGLGTIGLAVVEGAKIAGASHIIGIDRLDSKLEKGKDFGLTDTLNTSSTVEKPIQEIIRGMTNGGVDFSFDCTGNPDIISAAMECCRPDGGVAVILGLMDSRKLVSFHPSSLLLGKTWTSGLFGGYKARTHLPGLVEKCIDGVINLDQYVTHTMPFSEINKAVQLLDAGECLRCIMDYDS